MQGLLGSRLALALSLPLPLHVLAVKLPLLLGHLVPLAVPSLRRMQPPERFHREKEHQFEVRDGLAGDRGSTLEGVDE